jgi:hypothetical protein
MLSWLFGKIKLLFGIAAIGGPIMAFLGWQDVQRIEQIEKEGVETVAAIDGATRKKSRRGGTTYSVNLAWKDAKGEMRKAEGLSISQAFAGQIIRGDKIVRDAVKVKYLPGDADTKPIIVEDKNRQEESDTFMMQAGMAAGGVGIVGAALMLLFGRRRKEEQPA